MKLPPRRVLIATIALCASLPLGCTRAPVVEFTRNAEIAELSELHQKNIADGMVRLFGTSTTPWQRIIDPEAEDVAEGEPLPVVDVVSPDHLKHGARVYNARCSGCHGITGDGAGVAGSYLRPRPRDYRRGIYKFTSTPYGMKPARHDLIRTIRRGAKGTSMPAFPWLSDEDLDAVVDYVVYLSTRGEVEAYVTSMAPEYDDDEEIDFYEFVDGLEMVNDRWKAAEDAVVLPVTAEPHYGEETVVAGRKLFLSQGCSKCHGIDGKGQVEWINPEFLAAQAALPEDQRIQINYDAWGEPAPAADLTARMLHGGRRPIDIYRRVYTGINGTPMPAFDTLFVDSPENLWQLVHYVRHIIEGGDPTAGISDLPPSSDVGTVSESGAATGVDADLATDSEAADVSEESADAVNLE